MSVTTAVYFGGKSRVRSTAASAQRSSAERRLFETIARPLAGTLVHTPERSLRYAGNENSHCRLAIEQGAEIVIMVDPGCEDTQKLLSAIVSLMGSGLLRWVRSSPILAGTALRRSMLRRRCPAKRALVAAENRRLAVGLAELPINCSAFPREAEQSLAFEHDSPAAAGDSPLLAEIPRFGGTGSEVSLQGRLAPKGLDSR